MRKEYLVSIAVFALALASVASAQQLDPALEAARSLRMPATLFGTMKQFTTTASVPAAKPPIVSAVATQGHAGPNAASFVPAPISKVVLYGLQLTFYEHVMRVATQSFTREQLAGKFWPDYFASVKVPKGWADKDDWEVNYIGHAISGGAFTRVWLEQREARKNSPKEYFKAMGRAAIFTAVLSVQYEVGPMSEASIGNVGLNQADVGWNDYIWTPIGGVLWTMAEDAIDKYALSYVDRHVPFVMARAAARMILNPSRMLANIGMNRSPWNRSGRSLDGHPTGR